MLLARTTTPYCGREKSDLHKENDGTEPTVDDNTDVVIEDESHTTHISELPNNAYPSDRSTCTLIYSSTVKDENVIAKVDASEPIAQLSASDDSDTSDSAYQLTVFTRHRILGEGRFGQVWMVSDKRTDQVYALKLFSKYDLIAECQYESVLREKEITKMVCNHPFVVNLIGTFQDDRMLYILEEFCQGGELFSRMVSHGSGGLPEAHVQFYTFCIADALSYMHNLRIVYRDLKSENVMIDSLGYVKLIDFGNCKKILDGEKLFTFCGTPRFVSPEIIAGTGHGFPTDWWSLGVLTYEMLTGENPFFWEGQDEPSLFCAIAEEEYPPLPDHLSVESVDFVGHLLIKDPHERLGFCNEIEIHEHAWLKDLDATALQRKEIQALWIPNVKDKFDTIHFDDWDHVDDRVAMSYPKLLQKEEALFNGF